MTEHMGPYEHSCPLALLAMAQPAPTEPSSVEWRTRVRAYHETTQRRRAFFKSLHVGQLVSLQHGCHPPQVTILTLSPLVGTWEERRYRLKPGHVSVPADFPHSSVPLEHSAY